MLVIHAVFVLYQYLVTLVSVDGGKYPSRWEPRCPLA